MPFQFMCPQGHLLEGTEPMMGQQSQCPLCGSLFIVPVVGPPVAQPVAMPPGYGAPGVAQPGVVASPAGAPAPSTATAMPVWGGPSFGPPASETAAPPSPTGVAVAAEGQPPAENPPPAEEPAAQQPEEERIVRILCPNKHELHTPMDMIGMEALCPQCNEQFLLRYEDSIEYVEERKAARLQREEAFNKAALKWSIIAAVVVVLALVVMIVMAIVD